MTPARRRLGALTFAVGLFAAACGSSGSDSPTIALGADSEAGAAVPATAGALPGPTGTDDVFVTEFRDFNGGEQSLADVADGKPVVLNFFASWCPSCVAEMPDFEQVSRGLGTDVQFVGLATQDAPEDAVVLAQRTGVTYPLGFDPAGEFFNVFNGLGMPTTAFLSAQGEIVHVFTGQLSDESLAEKIDEFLL